VSPERLVPIPHTHRSDWPGSSFVEPLALDREVALTAWLPARPGGELDLAAVYALAQMPPAQRRYAQRKELARATGAADDDVAALRAYCERSGIRVAGSYWRSLELAAPIGRLVEAFGATVASFADADGTRFRHRSGSLHAPAAVARAMRGLFGLHQWPRSHKLGALQRHLTPLSARDVEQRYAFPDGDGAGQTIGVVQFRGEFRGDDFDRCLQSQNATAEHPIVKRVDDAAVRHEIETTKDLEAALDVQIVAALAPRARIVIYEAPDDERGFLDAARTAIFDEEFRPSILSISYGWPERLWTPVVLTLLDELFAAASLLGISVFCSSGDHGARRCAGLVPVRSRVRRNDDRCKYRFNRRIRVERKRRRVQRAFRRAAVAGARLARRSRRRRASRARLHRISRGHRAGDRRNQCGRAALGGADGTHQSAAWG